MTLGSLSVIGVAACTGAIVFSFDASQYLTAPTSWLMYIAAFAVFSVLFVVSYGGVQGYLIGSLTLPSATLPGA